MNQPNLYMCLIGCKPAGRHIEQHDIFFGIAVTPAELRKQIEQFWPDGGRLHLDAWRKITCVNGIAVEVQEHGTQGAGDQKSGTPRKEVQRLQLYFINLGGYQPGMFEELHHKLITVQPDKAGAIQAAKKEAFFIRAEGSHVDDQYGVDIDDLYNVEDILAKHLKEKYYLKFTDMGMQGGETMEDTWHIGYTKLSQLDDFV